MSKKDKKLNLVNLWSIWKPIKWLLIFPHLNLGTIVAIYGKPGETIHVGSPLVEIEIEGVEGQAAVEEANKVEPVNEEGAGVVGTLEVAGNSAYLPSSNEGISTKSEEQAPTSKTQKKAISTPRRQSNGERPWCRYQLSYRHRPQAEESPLLTLRNSLRRVARLYQAKHKQAPLHLSRPRCWLSMNR